MTFIHDHFLLQNETAQRLFQEYARLEPILDFHSHLPAKDIAENRSFKDLYEIWLEGDHYKWRAMRTNGFAERFCTGDAAPYEKFEAWAATVPGALRNPLYHWTHLELKRYFDIDLLLNPSTARAIWEQAKERLAAPELQVRGILKKFGVAALCTTDDPTDDLSHHLAIAKSDLPTRVYPTFRPDKAFRVDQPEAWNAWIARLEAASNISINSLANLKSALDQRHEYFHQLGARLSDHGLEHCFCDFCSDSVAESIFAKVRSGKAATAGEYAQFASTLLLFCGYLDSKRGWTKQLHLGAMRNNNSRQFAALGPDTGFDSIGDYPQAQSLAAFLDRLDRENALPKTIIYNLNPRDNYVCGTMLGNFQDGSIPGKIQLGSGWWFLDQKEGIEWQLNALSNLGLLSRFIGMLTDSRSFMSFPRHEYFRRVLCNMLGREMESGELPADLELIGSMVRNISFANARDYLGLRVKN